MRRPVHHFRSVDRRQRVGGVTFGNFENLQGGSQADTFRFANGQAVTGTVDGRGGIDAFDYSAYTTRVTVNLQTRVATGLASFLSIDGLTGGSVFDTLVPPTRTTPGTSRARTAAR